MTFQIALNYSRQIAYVFGFPQLRNIEQNYIDISLLLPSTLCSVVCELTTVVEHRKEI